MIIIIDNYDSFTYNLYQLASIHYPQVEVIRNDVCSVDEIAEKEPSALILSPGPGHPEDAGICMHLISEMFDKIPILGVCLGHQAIAKVFGGEVTLADEVVHGKWGYVFHNRSGIYQKMPLPFKAGRYHSLMVSKAHFPKELIVEAENELGEIMGLKHASFPTFGVQFHPESILTTAGTRLMENFIKLCR